MTLNSQTSTTNPTGAKCSTVYIVVPCYNEQEVLPETSKRLKEKVNSLIAQGKITPQSRIVFVDDGSRDNTWNMIAALHGEDPLFSGLKLSRNRGHQNAVLAGLLTCKEYADAVISMDADLQDDINAIDAFIDEFHAGHDIVYGVRSKRETDTAFKRLTAEGFYKIMQKFGVDIIDNHADYRLMSRRALDALAQYKEVNLFLRGIVPLIGYPYAIVKYERAERFAGESKYPLKKMLALAFDGITSFSVKPIKMVTALGVTITILSVLALLYCLVAAFIPAIGVPGLVLVGCIFLSCGLIISSLGLIGSYIGKIYGEVKARPRFFVEDLLLK